MRRPEDSILPTLSVILAIAQIAAVIRVLTISARSYRWFLAAIAVSLTQLGAALLANAQSGAYLTFWLITNPLLLIGIVAVALEILARIPDQYNLPRSAFDRKKLLMYFQVALLIALLSAIVEALRASGMPVIRSVWLPWMFTLARVTTFLVAVLLFLVRRYIAFVPVPFQTNLVIHSRLFAAWVMVMSIATLVENLWHTTAVWLASNTFMLGVSALLFTGWALLLRPEGERYPERLVLDEREIATLKNRRQEIMSLLRKAASR